MRTGEYEAKLYRMFNEREQQVFELNLMIIETTGSKDFHKEQDRLGSIATFGNVKQ